MKIYLPNEVDTWVEKQDSGKLLLNYPDDTKWRHYWDEVHDIEVGVRFSHNVDFIHEAISESSFPYMDLLLDKLEIYITTYPIACHVNASANGRGMGLYGRGTQIPKAMTHYIVMHELGHVLDFRFARKATDKHGDKWYFYNRYREIRGWKWNEDEGNWDNENLYPWHLQATEWFAEDFRYLFGGLWAKQDFWGVGCEKPTGEVRELMLAMCE